MPHPRFKEILDKMYQVHLSKDHDYAGEQPFSNFRKADKLGVPAWKGALIRMSDKWSRLENLAGKEDNMVKDESFDDTLLDLANYAIIVYILREERTRCVAQNTDSNNPLDASNWKVAPDNEVIDLRNEGYPLSINKISLEYASVVAKGMVPKFFIMTKEQLDAIPKHYKLEFGGKTVILGVDVSLLPKGVKRV